MALHRLLGGRTPTFSDKLISSEEVLSREEAGKMVILHDNHPRLFTKNAEVIVLCPLLDKVQDIFS